MHDQLLLATGMFRSGTTLVARMLQAHGEIVLASDPLARVFKTFRNVSARAVMDKYKTSQESPLADYHFDKEGVETLSAVQNSSLEATTDTVDLPSLRQSVAAASALFSPRIKPFLHMLEGRNFHELFSSGHAILDRAYGKANSRVLGFKEVWVGEFAKHYLQGFHNAKVIHILRDPRGVCASNHVTNEKYPLLFLIRQWRKLTLFAWRDKLLFPDRVHVLRYEDLLRSPETSLREIMGFLGLRHDPNLLDPRSYVDGDLQPWSQNSSHFSGGQHFNLHSIDRWKQTLSERQQELIETLCQAEMRLFGYTEAPSPFKEIPLSHVTDPILYDRHELAEWIRPFSPDTPAAQMREMALEAVRSRVLHQMPPLAPGQKQALFLLEDFYDHLRYAQAQGLQSGTHDAAGLLHASGSMQC